MVLLCGCTQQSGTTKPTEEAAKPPVETLKLSSEQIQSSPFNTVQADRREVIKLLAINTSIQRDESQTTQILATFTGKIDEVFVANVGAVISKGEPLLKISSPEVLQTQESYLKAIEQADNPNEQEPEKYSAEAKTYRQKLLDFGMTPEDIAHVQQTKTPFTALTYYSLVQGIVRTRHVSSGSEVAQGTVLYDVVDLSNAMAEGEISNDYLPFVSKGQTAQLFLPSYPGKAFPGRVSNIIILSNSGKTRLQFTFNNIFQSPSIDKRGTVILKLSLGELLAIPKQAVVTKHKLKYVYVPTSMDQVEVREISVGLEGDSYVQVLSGLNEGSSVITNPQILPTSVSK